MYSQYMPGEKRYTSIKHNRGAVLVMVMMTVLILTVLGTALLSISISEYRMERANRDSVAAYYLAEGGLEKAVHQISIMDDIQPDQLLGRTWEMGEEDADLLEPDTGGGFTVIIEDICLIDTMLNGEEAYAFIYEAVLRSRAAVGRMSGEIEALLRVEDYTAEGWNNCVEVKRWRQIR